MSAPTRRGTSIQQGDAAWVLRSGERASGDKDSARSENSSLTISIKEKKVNGPYPPHVNKPTILIRRAQMQSGSKRGMDTTRHVTREAELLCLTKGPHF